jgi:transcriptional regulator with XRE-family HTH domain
MNSIKTLRKKLGLSQYDLAEYLGITRSQLNMAERGERGLNTASMLKISRMEIAITALNTGKRRLPEQPAAEQEKENVDREQFCRDEAARLENIHARMTRKAALLGNYIALLQELIITVEQDATAAHERDWLEGQKSAATRRLLKCGETKRAAMEIKIAALKSEAGVRAVFRKKMP